jgi:predicted O-methyltransferase YrrM
MASVFQKIVRRLTRSTRRALTSISADDQALLKEIQRRKLTYLPAVKLASIVTTCRSIEENALDGEFVEAGCALGGSAILIAKVKNASRSFKVYDVFDMIPPPSKEDGSDVKKRYEKIISGKSRGIGGDQYYGYENELLAKVRSNLADFDIREEQNNVHLIEGLVQDTLHPDGPIAFAHIDVDWYEPVLHCLQSIVPRLIVGGSIILDDYADWSGCRKATDEYFANASDEFEMDSSAQSLRITRVRA